MGANLAILSIREEIASILRAHDGEQIDDALIEQIGGELEPALVALANELMPVETPNPAAADFSYETALGAYVLQQNRVTGECLRRDVLDINAP